MDNFLNDLRYGMRMLVKRPGFSFIAAMTLALGIGANTAIFSVVNAVLLNPLPYKDPSRIVVALHNGGNPVSPADFIDWREQNTVFENLTAAELWSPSLTGRDQPEQLWGLRATDTLFTMLGAQPMLGRTFLAGEDQPAAAPVVIIGHRLWQRRFGGDPGLVGQTLTLDGRAYTVVGVMPQGFEFPLFWATKAEMWAPLPLADRTASRAQSLRIFGRLKEGVTLKQAQSEMDTIAGRLAQAHPDTNANLGAVVVPLHQKVVGNVSQTLFILLGAVGFVLLIACANIGNLLLARASARHKEIAIRLALGATRIRLVRQLLTESFLLAIVGGGVGLLLALWCVDLLVAGLPADILPRQQAIGVEARVLAFTLLLSVVTAILFGLVPALGASRPDLNQTLKEGGRAVGGGARGHRLRGLLVVSEVALALVLLIGAGLMIKSFARLQTIDPGFDAAGVLTMTVSVAGTKQAPGPQRIAFFDQAMKSIEALPGVESASAVNHLPLAGDIWNWSFGIEGRAVPTPAERPRAAYRVARTGYFHTMGIELVGGRDFSEQDNQQAPGVVVINETMARRHWPGEDAVGKRIKLGATESPNPWLSVVGVVKDVRQQSWTEEPANEMYLPYLQSPNYLNNPSPHFSYLTIVVRTSADPARLASAVRNAVWAIEPNAPVSSVATMERVISDEVWQPRFSMMLLGGFALVAMLLAGVGIYGVISYSVTERTHELGVRLALGAQRRDVQRLVIKQGMKLALAGVGVGLTAALAMTRVMQTLLFQVSTTDPATFIVIPLILTGVALGASFIPARRASRVDPMVALRYE
jgi:putative ABC transport system permease protein